MADIPTAQPLPQLGTIQPLGVGAGLSSGLEAGTKMGYMAQQTQALQLQNKYLPATLALKQQEMQMAMQKQQAEIHAKQIDDSLNFLATVGEKVKIFSPKSRNQAIANGINAVSKAAPEWNIPFMDPSSVPPEGEDLVVQFAKLRRAHQAGDISDADFQLEGSNMLNQMSEFQRSMMKENDSILGTPSYEPGQAGTAPGSPTAVFNTKTGQIVNPQGGQPMPAGSPAFVPATTAASTLAENQRSAAGATAPLVVSAYSVNLAKTALSKGDELNDHIAINEFGKLINNGMPVPLPELQKMAKAGTWGPKFAQAFSKFTGEGALSPEQRTMMQSALDTFGQSLQAQTATRTAQYPGATAPAMPITKKASNGKTYVSPDGGKTWLQQ